MSSAAVLTTTDELHFYIIKHPENKFSPSDTQTRKIKTSETTQTMTCFTSQLIGIATRGRCIPAVTEAICERTDQEQVPTMALFSSFLMHLEVSRMWQVGVWRVVTGHESSARRSTTQLQHNACPQHPEAFWAVFGSKHDSLCANGGPEKRGLQRYDDRRRLGQFFAQVKQDVAPEGQYEHSKMDVAAPTSKWSPRAQALDDSEPSDGVSERNRIKDLKEARSVLRPPLMHIAMAGRGGGGRRRRGFICE
jgi:hypothetical protein